MANLNDLNSAFRPLLDAYTAALDKEGIGYKVDSGYRSPEQQSEIYARSHQGKDFPAAPPWLSFHNYGLGADVILNKEADYARAHQLAAAAGLADARQGKAFTYDRPHVEMPGSLSDVVDQYHLANWRPSDAPAPAAGSIAYAGPSGAAVSAPVDGALAKSNGPDFYNTAMMHESGGQNIPNAAGGWNAAGGYFQFTPPTWASMRAARPDLNLPESVKDANQDQQTAAYKHLVSQNVEALQKAGLPITDQNVFMGSFLGGEGATKFLTAMKDNPGASAAELFPKEAKANPTVFYNNGKPRSLNDVFALQTGKFGTGNTTGFGPDAAPASAVASNAAPKTGWDWLADKLTAPPTDKQGNPIAGGKSPLEDLTSAASSRLQAEGQTERQEAPQSQMPQGPGARNVSPLLSGVAQTYAQTLANASRPLTWNDQPIQGAGKLAGGGLPQAGQVPGMTLNSFQPPSQGLGYGVPDVGFGFG